MPKSHEADQRELLKPGEVAAKLSVNPRTVHRMAEAGHLTAVHLPSGQRRYHRAEIEAILSGSTKSAALAAEPERSSDPRVVRTRKGEHRVSSAPQAVAS